MPLTMGTAACGYGHEHLCPASKKKIRAVLGAETDMGPLTSVMRATKSRRKYTPVVQMETTQQSLPMQLQLN